jgi:putative membrane protein
MNVIAVLPHVNAGLNAAAAICLLIGFVLIRCGAKRAHRTFMLTATGISGLFLVSYVTLRFFAPIFAFQGEGAIRIFYFSLLATHVVMAMAIVPLVGLTLYRALSGNFDKHRRIARWTWPVWMYVSVTGIAVYLMLYQFFPGHEVTGLPLR